MKTRIVLLIGVTLLLFQAAVMVPHAAAQGPPILTDSALLTGFDAVALRTFGMVAKMSSPAAEMSVTMAPAMVPYQVVVNRLVAVAAIPYLSKELRPRGMPSQLNTGLGDLQLLGEYNIFQRDAPVQTTRAIVVGGVKLPTGGHTHPVVPLRLGTGSVDYRFGTDGMWAARRLGLYTDLHYFFTTEADQIKVGEALHYDLAIAYRLLPVVYETYPATQVSASLELNGVLSQKDQVSGRTVEDSGGHTLFLSPGITLIPARTVLFEAAYQIPIVQSLNGTQMTTDWRILVGLRWLIM